MLLYLALTAGLVARTIVAIGLHFRPKDALWISGCVLLGLVGVARADGAWVALPLLYAAFAVFVFKKYILQPVTEGMLLLFGLLGLYVFLVQTASFDLFSSTQPTVLLSYTFPPSYFLIFLLVYLAIAFSLAVTRVRSSHGFQIAYMIMFMMLNIWITYVVSVTAITLSDSFWELAVIGFVYLPFLANVFYVLYFIPIPLRKRQSFSERMQEIARHGRDIEKQYFDVDLDGMILLANVGFAIVFCAAHLFGLLSLPLMLSLAITCGAILNHPPHKPVFTPERVTDRW